jgi:hypothetical protein
LAHKEWDYKEHSAMGNQVVGALKSFGLVDVFGTENDRKLQLTDLAYRLLNHSTQTGPDWNEMIQKSALMPPIYAELWKKWDGDEFPDNDLIRHYLVLDREEGKFNPERVDGFIDSFRDTLRFSQLLPDSPIDLPNTDGNDKMPSAGGRIEDLNEIGSPAENELRRTRRPKMPGTKEAVLPLDTGAVVISWPERISPDEIESVESWLEIMKKKVKRASQEDDADAEAKTD